MHASGCVKGLGEVAEPAVEAFVGRERELAVLRREFAAACAGRFRLLTIRGEAGAGKTALVRAFLRSVEVGPVLTAVADPAEATLPFGVLGQLAGQLPAAARAGAGLLSLRPPPANADPLLLGGELLDAIDRLPGPAVIFLDRVECCDGLSERALVFAARRLQAAPLLWIVTGTREPAGFGRLVTDGEVGSRIDLRGLAALDLARLARRLGAGPLDLAAAHRLARHTGGNPRHARALLEEVGTAGIERIRGALPAPRAVAADVRARLARLPEDARHLVNAAAVCDGGVLLSVVLGVAAAGGRPADMDAALRDALAEGLLVEVPGTAGREVTMPDPLIRAAVHDALAPEERRRLHASAARQLRGTPALVHRILAASRPDAALADEVGMAAADALAAGATEHAARLALWRADLTPPGPARDRLWLSALRTALDAGYVGRVSRLRADIGACAPSAARTCLLAYLDLALGRDARSGLGLAVATDPPAGPGDPDAEAVAAAALAWAAWSDGRFADAETFGERATRLCAGRAGLLPIGALTLLLGLASQGRRREALARADALVGRRSGGGAEHAALVGARALLRVMCDEPAAADRDLERLVAAGAFGGPGCWPVALLSALAECRFRLGMWDEAESYAEAAADLGADPAAAFFRPWADGVAAHVLAARGRLDAAEAHARAALAALGQTGVGQPARMAHAHAAAASVRRARGDPGGVLAALAPVLAEPVRGWMVALGRLRARVMWAEALVDLGRRAEAAAGLRELAEGLAARGGTPAAAGMDLARLRGRLAEDGGYRAAAEAAFVEGLALPDAEAPFEAALLETAYGGFLRRAGQRRQAAEVLHRARARLVALGAAPALAGCDRELRACGVSPCGGGPGDLTERERQVAGLVAAGLSNRQVAAELHVSAKAVEYHLSRIFTKLRIRGRGDIAARLPQVLAQRP